MKKWEEWGILGAELHYYGHFNQSVGSIPRLSANFFHEKTDLFHSIEVILCRAYGGG